MQVETGVSKPTFSIQTWRPSATMRAYDDDVARLAGLSCRIDPDKRVLQSSYTARDIDAPIV
jgi:hypothetical protein